MRQLMALPFLPASHKRETFEALKDRANSPQLEALVTVSGSGTCCSNLITGPYFGVQYGPTMTSTVNNSLKKSV
ncbi:hypothetical protein DPMN_120474 [Dreissena polymorpha]|uniref:Uncharacterized protein n=1 Tax=Dreissena polymorpha TaxID=45954 RepID=A0A9D4JQ67_DREPO|nr:hypothetical protein DPMN_120474 [Dreissena polymorpha]